MGFVVAIFVIATLGFIAIILSRGQRITYYDTEGQKVTETLKRRQPRNIATIEIPDNIELTDEFKQYFQLFENTNNNYFLTGKAGTGKSTLLKYFRTHTSKNHGVVAPTGIASINVQGQTIHSFFGFGIDITPESVRAAREEKLNLFRKLDTLIIDEISMVRADLLDCINESLKKNRRSDKPFGGVQIIAIGDPFQLPPVVKNSERKFFSTVYSSPFFFSSKAYKNGGFSTLELTRIFRQSDNDFIRILNSIRVGEASDILIDELNQRVEPNNQLGNAIKLVPTNKLAQIINDREMQSLPTDEKEYVGYISGTFLEDSTPTAMNLVLKVGAKVMLLNNDQKSRWVNGDTGQIISLSDTSIQIKFDDGTFDDVGLNEWDNIRFDYVEEEKKIVPEIVGKFIQIPVKLAWAVTIHKSQGKTFNNVHIDFGRGAFAPGQAYVALSRCRSLEGLTLEVPMMPGDVITDPGVNKFMGISNTVAVEKPLKTRTTIDGDVPKSFLNRLRFFIQQPEKYATGTSKANKIIDKLGEEFELYRNQLDDETIGSYQLALKKYRSVLHT